MNTKTALIVRCALTVVLATAAWVETRAEVVTIKIEAKVNAVDDAKNVLGGKIMVGDAIDGYYTYDTSAPNLLPADYFIGMYAHTSAPSGIVLQSGGLTFRSNPTNPDFTIFIQDFPDGADGDMYAVTEYNPDLFNPSNWQYCWLRQIHWDVVDPTGTAFSSTALPAGPPDLEDFTSSTGAFVTNQCYDENFEQVGWSIGIDVISVEKACWKNPKNEKLKKCKQDKPDQDGN